MITVIITIIVLDTSFIIFIRLTGVTTAVNYSTLLSLKSGPSLLFYSFLRLCVWLIFLPLLLLLRLLFLFSFFFFVSSLFFSFRFIFSCWLFSLFILNRIVFITIIIVIHGNQWDVVWYISLSYLFFLSFSYYEDKQRNNRERKNKNNPIILTFLRFSAFYYNELISHHQITSPWQLSLSI